jgi:hypothetical protein
MRRERRISRVRARIEKPKILEKREIEKEKKETKTPLNHSIV